MEWSKMLAKRFNPVIKEELSELLQRTKAFKINEMLAQQYLFACVVQDRLHDSINYLDSHLTPPQNVEEFYLFMIHADIVFSAVKEFFEIPIIKENVIYPFGSNCKDNDKDVDYAKFFGNTFKKAFPKAQASDIPIDDDFFKYIRALSFAHPYETSRAKFIDKKGGERHYSPFPMIKNCFGFPVMDNGDIAIVVYSNGEGNGISDKQFIITLRYTTFKDFLISRYDTLEKVIAFVRGLLDSKEKEWLQHKIDRTTTWPEIIGQILEIYKERHEDSGYIEEFAHLLETPIPPGCPTNEESVRKYKEALRAIIPSICDAVDNGNYNDVARMINALIDARIPDFPDCLNNAYRNMNYHYGKIAMCCHSYNGNDWRQRIMQDLPWLMKGYAGKWVSIDPQTMSKDEIMLLLSAARFLESSTYRGN